MSRDLHYVYSYIVKQIKFNTYMYINLFNSFIYYFNSFSLFYHQFSTLRQKENGAVHRHATFDLLSRPKGAGVKLGRTKGLAR